MTKGKKYRVTPEVDEMLEKIEKNLEFGKKNNCEQEFKEGGKYYKAFYALVRDAAILGGNQLRSAMQSTLPAPERRPEMKTTVEKLQTTALNNGFKELIAAFSTADAETIKSVYRKIYSNYCEAYSAQVMPIKDLVA